MNEQAVESEYDFAAQSADEIAEYISQRHALVSVSPTDPDGRIDFRSRYVKAGSLSSWTVACPTGMAVKRLSRPAHFIVVMPLAGQLDIVVAKDQMVARPEIGLIADGAAISQSTFGVGSRHVGIAIAKDAMVTRLAALLDRPVLEQLTFKPYFDMRAGASLMLKQLAEALQIGVAGDAPLSRSPLALANLTQAITNLLLESFKHNLSAEMQAPSAAASPKHVKRALDYMRSNAGLQITMDDIAQASGVSVRALQIAFRRFRGSTPMASLRRIRLEQAHQELGTADVATTVADIARKWGFMHLGHFAALYQAAYGCKPSDTLRGGGSGGRR